MALTLKNSWQVYCTGNSELWGHCTIIERNKEKRRFLGYALKVGNWSRQTSRCETYVALFVFEFTMVALKLIFADETQRHGDCLKEKKHEVTNWWINVLRANFLPPFWVYFRQSCYFLYNLLSTASPIVVRQSYCRRPGRTYCRRHMAFACHYNNHTWYPSHLFDQWGYSNVSSCAAKWAYDVRGDRSGKSFVQHIRGLSKGQRKKRKLPASTLGSNWTTQWEPRIQNGCESKTVILHALDVS